MHQEAVPASGVLAGTIFKHHDHLAEAVFTRGVRSILVSVISFGGLQLIGYKRQASGVALPSPP